MIDLYLSIFPWVGFRQTKGAVKLHMVITYEGYLPAFVDPTKGGTREIRVARPLLLPRASVVVFCRGYDIYA